MYYKNSNKKPINILKLKNIMYNHQNLIKRIESSDFKFLNLPNQIKILIDCHDEPNNDGFYRFINENYPLKIKILKN